MLALQATSERHTLLASMYKRIGQARHALEEDVSAQAGLGHPDWLDRMCEQYQKADQVAQAQGGLRYYALLNALDGLALSHALQPAPHPEKLAESLALAQEDARQRNRTEASFFHAVAEIDAERTAALWACLMPIFHAAAPLTDAAAREQLRQRYAALRQRLGTARHASGIRLPISWTGCICCGQGIRKTSALFVTRWAPCATPCVRWRKACRSGLSCPHQDGKAQASPRAACRKSS